MAGEWRHYPSTKELKNSLKTKGLCLWKFKKDDVCPVIPPTSIANFMDIAAIRKSVEGIRHKVNADAEK